MYLQFLHYVFLGIDGSDYIGLGNELLCATMQA